MAILRATAGLIITFTASISVSHAGPCADQIGHVQVGLDARLAAKAATGPSAAEGASATMHRQPTPGSIAAAEEKLGNLSSEKAGAILQAMARARAADSAGDKDACEQALADVQKEIGP
jgi:hypothetical protein